MLIKYRADIDGLRALAVLVVIFYHTGVPGFSGGFVGVDVFFVISGYLITSIILYDIQSGQFSIARFYERRIRRIFPALFPVIAFTVIVEYFLYDPLSFKDLANTVTSTTLFTSNILFWHRSGYFDLHSLQRPLLHTWSLAVEEQFYICFPLILLAINRFLKNRFLHWILGISTLSLVASICGVYTDQVATFYLVPTRAWELLFGSFLSLDVIPELKSNVHRNFVSIIGLSLIVFCVCFYTETTLFPGFSAIAPVVGSTFIIYSGIGGGASIVKKILSLKPIVYIGLISYSLYLWHWPLIVFSKYLILRDLTPLEIIGIILITFLFSILSLKFIEQPFRGIKPVIQNRKQLFILASVVILIFSIIATVIHLTDGIRGRFPEMSSILKDIEADPGWVKAGENEKKTKRLSKGEIPARVGSMSTIPCFILWGDSHARALIPAIEIQANHHSVSGFIATQSGHPPILGIDGIESNMDVSLKHDFNDGVISFIKDHPYIRTIILTAFWERHVNGKRFKKVGGTTQLKDVTKNTPNQSNPDLIRIGLLRTVETLSSLGRQIVIVSDVPDIGYDPIYFYWLQKKGYSSVVFPSAVEYITRNKKVYNLLYELSLHQNVTVVYPESLLFDKNSHPIIMVNDHLIYRDSNHLSKYGAKFVSPVFDDVFNRIANEKQLESQPFLKLNNG